MENLEDFRTDHGILRGLPWGDLFCAGILALVTGLWASFCLAPGFPPEIWEDLTAAAGLRPPVSPYPGLWRLAARGLVRYLGLPTAMMTLKVLGSVSASLMASLTFLTVRDLLECASAPCIRNARWRGMISRLVVAVPTLLFATSLPVGRLARCFGPETLLAVLILTSLFFLQRFLRAGSAWALYLSMFLSGLISAETPIGFVLFGFILFKIILFTLRPYNPDLLFQNPALMQNMRWHMTAAFFWGWFLTTGADVWSFKHLNGWTAAGLNDLSDAFVNTVVSYATSFVSMSSLGGWCAGIGVCVVAYLTARALFRACVIPDLSMPFGPGIAFIGIGLLTYSQFANASVFWFWSRSGAQPLVSSPLLTFLFLYFALAAFVFALAVWSVSLYCRNERMVWLYRFPEALEAIHANPQFRQFAERMRSYVHVSRRLVPRVIFPLMILGALPFWRDAAFYEEAKILQDGIRLCVDELDGVRWIFTDGRLDAALELEAAMRGRRLTALSMIARRGSRTSYLNLRDVADEEDKLLLKGGAAEALRAWIIDKQERLDASALQLGVELFDRAKRPMPQYLGLCARTSVDPSVLPHFRAESERLERRILDFYERRGTARTLDGLTGELFVSLQWRLGRLLRFRSVELVKKGDIGGARELEERADALDEKNASLQNLVSKLNWISAQNGETMTPREGLALALRRADFRLACRYASPILHSHPDDADANFAMAMRYLMEEKWAASEAHFRIVLKTRPDSAPVLNNLAIVCFRQGRIKEATEIALRAQDLAPLSAEVADTVRMILRAYKND